MAPRIDVLSKYVDDTTLLIIQTGKYRRYSLLTYVLFIVI